MSGQRFWTLLDRLLGAKVTVPFEVSQERFPDDGIITKGVVPGIPNWRRKAGGALFIKCGAEGNIPSPPQSCPSSGLF